LITGHYYLLGDFNPSLDTFNLVASNGFESFILKLDNDGDFIWAKSFGGTFSLSIISDVAGDVYITGRMTSSGDFDPGVGNFTLNHDSYSDTYIVKVDAAGKFVWAKAINGDYYDYGEAISVDTAGNVYVVGNFKGTADFDPGSNILNITSSGNHDIFILKLSQTKLVNTNNISLVNGTSIFPNPSNGEVNVNLGNLKEASIKVYNITGQLIYKKDDIHSSIHKFQLSEFPGVYLIEINSQGNTQRHKLILE